MKKMFFSLVIILSAYGFFELATANASTGSTASRSVSVELTINSPGAGGSQFILKGLQTPVTPNYGCAKTSTISDAAGNGTSIHFALVDVTGVDKVKITVKGTLVGRLAVLNDTYVDSSGNSIAGKVAIRQYK